ncbi:uncharacterized protein V6R79_015149 [Siganus canaliculatus]
MLGLGWASGFLVTTTVRKITESFQDFSDPAIRIPESDQDRSDPAIRVPESVQYLCDPAITIPQPDLDLSDPAIRIPESFQGLCDPGIRSTETDQDLNDPGIRTTESDQDVSPDSDLTGEERLEPVDLSSTSFICRFPNVYNNSWFNSVTQAVLHLSAAQHQLRHQPPEHLVRLSTTPLFASLFLEALQRPGRVFRQVEILTTLLELSRAVPALAPLRTNDPLDFLEHLLEWVEDCGVQSTIERTEEYGCDCCNPKCIGTRAIIRGAMVLEPVCDGRETTIYSLFRSAADPSDDLQRCETCGVQGSKVLYYSAPDVLVLCLPRLQADGTVQDYHVEPSRFLDVPTAGGIKQIYGLSSAVGYTNRGSNGHVSSYLFRGQVTIRADDYDVSLASGKIPEELRTNGIIYRSSGS